jgi:predicted oxidoreductase (fatty acid repression mutant protein)
MEYWDAIKNRHSIYGLSDEKIVPRERIEEILRDTLNHLPSTYNVQSTRFVLLFGEDHKALWEITLQELKKLTTPERFAQTVSKVNGSFASGYGTILFFEDQAATDELIAKYPTYADKFTQWAQHTNAMHQYVVWTALEAEGLGASLQHYNPLIDQPVKERWTLPASWTLIAQMPFGKPTASGGQKSKKAIEERLKIFGV